MIGLCEIAEAKRSTEIKLKSRVSSRIMELFFPGDLLLKTDPSIQRSHKTRKASSLVLKIRHRLQVEL